MLKATSTQIPIFFNPISILALNHRTFRGGGVLPYINHIGMCRPRGWGFLHHFGLKTGKHFVCFGLESGMVFEGTSGVFERIYRLSKER